MRKTETCTRDEWPILIELLDGDDQDALMETLEEWNDDGCDFIEYTVDSLGRVDSESSPRPVTS